MWLFLVPINYRSVIMLTVSDMIALLKQDKLRPEQITVITHNTGNRQLRELIIRLEEKDLAKHVEIFNSGLIIKATVLPKEMVAFVNLKTLALQGHRSLCALPAWIGQLSNLEELTLYYNKNITSISPRNRTIEKATHSIYNQLRANSAPRRDRTITLIRTSQFTL